MKTQKNSVRRSLILSATALMISVAMLIGTTFAWFTDSVSSGKNKIVAGNLDVALEYKNGAQNEFTAVTTQTSLFDETALWEPGHVEYTVLKVHNAGTLALKYNLNVNVNNETSSNNVLNGEEFKLSDVLQYAAVQGDISGKSRDEMVADATAAAPQKLSAGYAVKDKALEAGSDDDIMTLVVWMPTDTGNEANYAKGAAIPTIDLGINLVATQYTQESDSFDNTYDKDAKYPAVGTATAPVDNEGKVTNDTTLVTDEKVNDNANTPMAKAVVPVDAKTTAAESDDSVQLVLHVDETATANITAVDTTMNKLRTLEVTMEGLDEANMVPVTVELYVGKNLENVVLYHHETAMTKVNSLGDVIADQQYYYDADTGYVTLKTATFSPFSVAYKKDVWTNHAAENYSAIDETSKTITIASAEELALFARNIKNGTNYNKYTVALAADIDLGEYIWEPMNAFGKFQGSTIDGNNHTISNMIVRGMTNPEQTGYGTGFIGDTNGSITIKNIIFDHANVSQQDPLSEKYAHGYYGNVCGVVMGYTYGTTVYDNVSVTNSDIWGYGKVGVILGMGADPGVSVTFKDCVSKGNKVHAVYNCGGLAGNIQRGNGVDNAKVENCTVDNVEFVKDNREPYVNLDNVEATFKDNDSTNGVDTKKTVSGIYWENSGYYWGGYADYYVSYGKGEYDAKPTDENVKDLANSEYCVNK